MSVYDVSPRHRGRFQAERPGRLEEAVRVSLAASPTLCDPSQRSVVAGAEKTLAASMAAVTWGASLWKAAPPTQQQPQQPQPPPSHAHPATAGVTLSPAARDTEGGVETPTGKGPAHAAFQPDPKLSDHGQADAADRDLYTTRSQQ
ncbi:unnamed protein product [Lampetra fluviatilis]